MMLSFSVSLIWLLAMLAAAAHVQAHRGTLAEGLRPALAFALTLTAAIWLAPQPNWVGVLVGLTAMWRLISGPSARRGGWLGGVCAGLAAALQVGGGVPLWIAGLIAGGALLAACLLSSRRMPAEPLLILSALAAPVVGLAGDLVYGWHSAAMLNKGLSVAEAGMPPLWAIGIVALALAAGIIRGLWARR